MAEERDKNTIELLFIFLKTLKIIPYHIYAVGVFLSVVITFFDAIFTYPKFDVDLLYHLNPLMFLSVLGFTLFILLIASMGRFALKYQDQANHALNQVKYASILTTDDAISGLTREINNHIQIKNTPSSKELLFPILQMTNKENGLIEAIARTKDILFEQRMVMEIVKRVPIEDTFAFNPLGMAVVTGANKDVFNTIVVEYSQHEEMFWKNAVSAIKSNQRVEDGIFMRFYAPYRIEQADVNSLVKIQTGLGEI